jgi:hypothetical protein
LEVMGTPKSLDDYGVTLSRRGVMQVTDAREARYNI